MRYGKIVFDLDGTFWQREVGGKKKSDRRAQVSPDIPLLVSLLDVGFEVAVCSGNSASHIIANLVQPLMKTLFENGQLPLAKNFYAFFQLGGGLARFTEADLIKWQQIKKWETASKKLFVKLDPANDKTLIFAPNLIDGTYVAQQSIDFKPHRKRIEQVLAEAVAEYQRLLDDERSDYDDTVLQFPNPAGDLREIKTRADGKLDRRVVQVTLKQFYSETHFKKRRSAKPKVSLRTKIAQFMNARLVQEGVSMIAVEGGSTSIDIINHDLSKKTAVEYFIRSVGHDKFENMIYFGDELHAGGNDVVIPLDLGVTSFSVGSSAIFHPCVFAAPQPGPQGTFAVLHSLLGFAPTHKGPNSVVAAFRTKHCRDIVVEKLGKLSAETLQSLALIATAESRNKDESHSQDLTDLHRLIGDQVRRSHNDERPPGTSHWSESEFEN